MMSDALGKAVEVLERELFHKLKLLDVKDIQDKKVSFNATSLVSAITVIKHIRDVLRGDASELDPAVNVVDEGEDDFEKQPKEPTLEENAMASAPSTESGLLRINGSNDTTGSKMEEMSPTIVSASPGKIAPEKSSNLKAESETMIVVKDQSVRQNSEMQIDQAPESASSTMSKQSQVVNSPSIGVLKPKPMFEDPSDKPLSSLKAKPVPRRSAPRKLTVEQMMSEVGETKIQSKHAWLFGDIEPNSSGTVARSTKASYRRSVAVMSSKANIREVPRISSEAKEENDPLLGFLAQVKNQATNKGDPDPLGAGPAIAPVKSIEPKTMSRRHSLKPKASAPDELNKKDVDQDKITESPSSVDPLVSASVTNKKKNNRQSIISRTNRSSRMIVPTEALLTEVDDWEASVRQQQAQRSEQEKIGHQRRTSLLASQTVSPATTAPVLSIPLLPSDDVAWVTSPITAGASVSALLGAVQSSGPSSSTVEKWSSVSSPHNTSAAAAMIMPPPKSELPADTAWVNHERSEEQPAKISISPLPIPPTAISASDAWASHETEKDVVVDSNEVQPSSSFAGSLTFDTDDFGGKSSSRFGSIMNSGGNFFSRALSFGGSPPKLNEDTTAGWPESNSISGKFNTTMRNNWGDDPVNPWD